MTEVLHVVDVMIYNTGSSKLEKAHSVQGLDDEAAYEQAYTWVSDRLASGNFDVAGVRYVPWQLRGNDADRWRAEWEATPVTFDRLVVECDVQGWTTFQVDALRRALTEVAEAGSVTRPAATVAVREVQRAHAPDPDIPETVEVTLDEDEVRQLAAALAAGEPIW